MSAPHPGIAATVPSPDVRFRAFFNHRLYLLSDLRDRVDSYDGESCLLKERGCTAGYTTMNHSTAASRCIP